MIRLILSAMLAAPLLPGPLLAGHLLAAPLLASAEMLPKAELRDWFQEAAPEASPRR